MSVYLYNLGFSASNAVNGNFSSGGSGIDASNAWFQYVGAGLPGGTSPSVSIITSLAPTSNWSPLTQPPSSLVAGTDYVLLRIFNSDNNPGGYLARTTAIFGQGESGDGNPVGNLQSPFTMGAYARPVIDFDTASITPPATPSWPGPVTDINPVTAASSWTYCLGLVHNPSAVLATVYIFNVGATVYEIASGLTYAYGIDPRMKVGGMGLPVATDRDKNAA
ncbi:MAG: hypothetical protein ABSE92_07240 [Terriglobales bacterium]|jgi:hypothetical protein